MNHTDTTTKPKRRLLRFSLRAMLLLMVVLCVLLGWWAERARKQREVVEWVRENGGGVMYRHELDTNMAPIKNPSPPGPRWLVSILGVDYFSEVVYVFGSKQSDVSRFSDLPSIKSLNLKGSGVTDISPIAKLNELESLVLSRTRIENVEPLVQLTKLKKLHLDDTPVADLTPLSRMPSLRSLRLARCTNVSDWTSLYRLTELEQLNLYMTGISFRELLKIKKALPDCVVVYRHERLPRIPGRSQLPRRPTMEEPSP